MASYIVQIVDNADGSWSLGAFRSPTNFGSGAASNNLNQVISTSAGVGFQQAGTNTADGLSHVLRSPSEVLARVDSMIRADRSFNG